LATTLSGPQFFYSRHFEQRNCSPFLYGRQFLIISFKWSHVLTEECPTMNGLRIASALQRSKFLVFVTENVVFVVFGSTQKVL